MVLESDATVLFLQHQTEKSHILLNKSTSGGRVDVPVESGEHIQLTSFDLFRSVITARYVCHTLRGERLNLVDFDGRVDRSHAEQLEFFAILESLNPCLRREISVQI